MGQNKIARGEIERNCKPNENGTGYLFSCASSLRQALENTESRSKQRDSGRVFPNNKQRIKDKQYSRYVVMRQESLNELK